MPDSVVIISSDSEPDISDVKSDSDEDGEYVPLWSGISDLDVDSSEKEVGLCCPLCQTNEICIYYNEVSELNDHIKGTHPESFCLYEFGNKKCNICNATLKSMSFLGLVKHIMEKTCLERKEKLKNKVQFLAHGLSLCPNNDKLKKLAYSKVEEKIVVIPKPPQKKMIRKSGPTSMRPKKAVKRPAFEGDLKACHSVFCRSRSTNILRYCESCQASRRFRKRKGQKSKAPQSKKNAKQEESSEVGKNEENDTSIYQHLFSSTRQSAIKANFKICPNSVRKMKKIAKAERRSVSQNPADQQQAQRNDPNGKFVLKVRKDFWDEVKNNYQSPPSP